MKQFLIPIALATCFGVHAQNQFSAQVHVTPPLGNFKSGILDDFNGSIDYAEVIGSAGTGIGIGLHYNRTLINSLSMTAGVDILRNPLARPFRKAYNANIEGSSTVRYSTYLNIPLSLGLRYTHSINDNVDLFGGLSINGNILKVTRYDKISESTTKEERYAPSFGFGITLQGGVTIQNRYQFSIGYRGLGNHVLTQTNTYSTSGYTDTYTESVLKSISVLQISFGIIF